MPSVGPQSGTVFGEDTSFGDTSWIDHANAAAADASYALYAGAVLETSYSSVRLTVSGSVAGDDKSAAMPTVNGYTSFGGAADHWNAGLTAANVKASNFGVCVACAGFMENSYYLKATGFDFSAIPDGSTIDGVLVEVKGYYAAFPPDGGFEAYIDHIRITVYYTEAPAGGSSKLAGKLSSVQLCGKLGN